MRTLLKYLFTVAVALIILTSCNRNSKRTLLLPTKQETLARERVILAYADSINNHLPTFLKHESLFYYLGENAFYVTKYHDLDQKNIVYIKHNHIGKTKITEQIYYIRNGQTVLVTKTEESEQPKKHADVIKKYFYNQADWMPQSEKQMNGKNLSLFNIENIVPGQNNWLREINIMEDALKQQGDFELVFEGIAEYPKAKYIILSQDKINTYRAPIRIEKEDALVTELRLNPERFRGRKLLITCKVRNKNEAIYVNGKPR